MSNTIKQHPSLQGKVVLVTGGASIFGVDRFPALDADSLQDPADVADAIHCVLVLPPTTVIAELTVLPLRETSWP